MITTNTNVVILIADNDAHLLDFTLKKLITCKMQNSNLI
jgi:hypothetical protein